MPTYSHVYLDGKRLTETEHQKLLLEEEHAEDPSPFRVYSIATLEAVTPAALAGRVGRQAGENAAGEWAAEAAR